MSLIDNKLIDSLNSGFSDYIIKKVNTKTFEQYTKIIHHYLRNQVLKKVQEDNYENIFLSDKILAFHAFRKSPIVQSALGNFLEYLKIEGKIDSKFHIEYPNIIRPERRKGEFLSLHAIQYLFSDNVEYDNDEEKIVASCVYALSFFCCFEQKHIINLKVSDVLMDDRLVRNVRQNDKNPHLLQWLELNEITYKYLKLYLDYRNNINPAINDSFIVFEGQSVNTDTLNKIFHILSRKNNLLQIDNSVNAQVLIRSMILYTLISSNGSSLSQILQFQELNEQVKQAHREYLSNYMRLHNKDDIQRKFTLDELITGYINVEKIFEENDLEIDTETSNTGYDKQTNEEKDDILNLIDIEIEYSEDRDLQQNDLLDFDGNSDNNQKDSSISIQRLVRDTKLSRTLKEHYQHKCQLCGYRLRSADGGHMSEAHHLKPYNRTHRGDDTIRNIIVLCPNCHTQFDQLVYAINPQTLQVHCLFEDDQYHLSDLDMIEKHVLGNEYLEYTWGLFQNKKFNVL